jgi:hypothetical protein
MSLFTEYVSPRRWADRGPLWPPWQDAWVHHELEINAIGRVRALPEKTDDEGNPIEREQPEAGTPLK